MRTIIIHSLYKSPNLKEKYQTIRAKSESHEYHVIIGLTCLLLSVVLLLGVVGPTIFSYYGGITMLGMDEHTKCAQNIHAFEQSGFYTSKEQFKAAMSHCYPK